MCDVPTKEKYGIYWPLPLLSEADFYFLSSIKIT